MTTAMGLFLTAVAFSEESINYEAGVITNASSGDYAPFYIGSNNHGVINRKNDVLLDVKAYKPLEKTKRFSYGYGVEAIGGYGAKMTYERYDATTSTWGTHDNKAASIWLQQAYIEAKYRCLHASVGLKEHDSKILNNELSSGDLIESGNSRPIPEVRAGFIDFQDIPLTNHWVQVDGEILYGKFTDNDWVIDHHNLYNDHTNNGSLYTYKRIYFRTNPEKRFSVTVGAQIAGIFGGTNTKYQNGAITAVEKYSTSLNTFWKMFLPTQSGKEGFYEGNTLGTFDLKARYTLPNNSQLSGYFQWLWEDGSGMAKCNGWDGLWGLEYDFCKKGFISGAVIEYLDFTNQSGPTHWATHDNPGTDLNYEATGGDDYYNNAFYNPYAHYGMSIGSPFLKSPFYNMDGYSAYANNRTRGIHAAIKGDISNALSYTIKFSHQQAWGSGRIHSAKPLDNTSFMAEFRYDADHTFCRGLKLKAQIGADHGTLRGDNLGFLLCASYSGIFKLGKK
jgi:hypothetical protein